MFKAPRFCQKYMEECLAIKRIILTSMSSELQRKHQNMDPTAIIEYVKKMVDTQLDIENSPVGSLVNHVIVLAENHEKLGHKLGVFEHRASISARHKLLFCLLRHHLQSKCICKQTSLSWTESCHCCK